MPDQSSWCQDREQLVRELRARYQALRQEIDRRGPVNGFQAGLLAYLERRQARLAAALERASRGPAPRWEERRRQFEALAFGVARAIREADQLLWNGWRNR
jgi:hypothetical protein